MKKAGAIEIDTNIEIAIALIFLFVVLGGLTVLYWDKIDVFISNFLPEFETPTSGDELILDSSGEKVNYLSNLLEATGLGTIKQTTAEEKEGYYEFFGKVAFYQNILANFLVISVYEGNTQTIKVGYPVDSNTENVDIDSKFNPVRILFASGFNNYVDFVYDGKTGKVSFGNSNTGNLFTWKSFSSSKITDLSLNGKFVSYSTSVSQLRERYPELKNLNDKDFADIATILSSNGLANFESNIVKIVDKEKEYKVWLSTKLGDDQYLSYKGVDFSSIPGTTSELKMDYIYRIITEGRPYLVASWGMNGYFSKAENQKLTYSCINDGSFEMCDKQTDGHFVSYPYYPDTSRSNLVYAGDTDISMITKIVYSKNGEIWVAQYDSTPKNYCSNAVSSGKSCFSI